MVPSPEAKAEEPLSALVFKTLADPYVGKLNFFRVYGGEIKSDSVAYNANKEKEEKIAQIFTMRGKHQEPLSAVKAGDLAVVAKLQATETGDTLCKKDKPVVLEGIDFPEPMLSIAIEPKSKGDEDKLSAIGKLTERSHCVLKEHRNKGTIHRNGNPFRYCS